MNEFLWIPGNGIDSKALLRLKSNFPKPKKPMGEAWFNTNNRYFFTYLFDDLDHIPITHLQKPMEEIASGTANFGISDDWTEWFHYLLGNTLHRSHEEFVDSYLEYLITAFMAIYPLGIAKPPYPEFQNDALHTLGTALMDPHCWNSEEMVLGTILHRSNNNPNKIWGWWDASGDFSASLFFCLKYLPTKKVAPWFNSLLAIKSPYWRAQLIVWLTGVHEILKGELPWPEAWDINSSPSVGWAWSHTIKLNTEDFPDVPSELNCFISAENRHALLNAVYSEISSSKLNQWIDDISKIDFLIEELTGLPEQFKEKYGI